MEGAVYQFQSALDIVGADQLDAREIMDCIFSACARDFQKARGFSVEKNQIRLEFIALVNIKKTRK
jgi:hypothetical protein